MKIEYRKGNLFTTVSNHILHGCNARGVMGSGVAKTLRTLYPKAYEDYYSVYSLGNLELGSIVSSYQVDGKIIHNAITQENYGRDSNTVYVSYWAIANCLKKLDEMGLYEISMPMIGSGLANGDWNVISAIIENTLQKTYPIVYVLE